MFLVVDVGNTNIVLGIYKERELLHHFRIGTNRQSTVDEYGVLIYNLFQMSNIDIKQIEGVIISSVVPPLMHVLVITSYSIHYTKLYERQALQRSSHIITEKSNGSATEERRNNFV